MTLIGWIVVAVSAGGLFAGWYFTHRTERLRRYRECARLFYDKAQPLLDDPDTPEEILFMIDFMNMHITVKSAARDLVKAMAISRNSDEVSKMRRRAKFAAAQAFLQKRPELGRAYAECMAAGLLAVSYNSGITGMWGWLARRGILGAVEAENEIAPGVVRTYVRRESKAKNNDPVAEPA